jgi:hypothetical protein
MVNPLLYKMPRYADDSRYKNKKYTIRLRPIILEFDRDEYTDYAHNDVWHDLDTNFEIKATSFFAYFVTLYLLQPHPEYKWNGIIKYAINRTEESQILYVQKCLRTKAGRQVVAYLKNLFKEISDIMLKRYKLNVTFSFANIRKPEFLKSVINLQTGTAPRIWHEISKSNKADEDCMPGNVSKPAILKEAFMQQHIHHRFESIQDLREIKTEKECEQHIKTTRQIKSKIDFKLWVYQWKQLRFALENVEMEDEWRWPNVKFTHAKQIAHVLASPYFMFTPIYC